MSMKRLALEVISFTVNEAAAPSKGKDGRKNRAEARDFLKGATKSLREARNTWLEAADIAPDFFERRLNSILMEE